MAGNDERLHIEYVPLDKLYDHPDNDYSNSEPELLDLMESIRHEGLGQLPLVRPWKDGYQIIAGHRRKECYARLAQEDPERYSTMPVNVREDLDDEMSQILLDTTNLMTRTLTPRERAVRYERIWKLVPELRRKDKSLKGVRTSQVIADIVTRETGQSVSRASIDRAIAAGRKAKEVSDLADAYSDALIGPWQKEFQQRDGFSPDAVKSVATRDGSVQESLWADYQRESMTPKQFSKALERQAAKTETDAERLLDAMIKQARQLSAMKVKDGVAIDMYRVGVLKRLLDKLSR